MTGKSIETDEKKIESESWLLMQTTAKMYDPLPVYHKHIMSSMYDIWQTLNFLLFSVDFTWCLI